VSSRWKNRQCRSVHSIIGATEKRWAFGGKGFARMVKAARISKPSPLLSIDGWKTEFFEIWPLLMFSFCSRLSIPQSSNSFSVLCRPSELQPFTASTVPRS
jgi:hypothetical protein